MLNWEISKSYDDTSELREMGWSDNWIWNVSKRSCDVITTGGDRKSVLFHPYWSNGTSAVRGTRSLNNCKCYWEISIQYPIYGSSNMIGVGNENALLGSSCYNNLIGQDNNGWGLSHKGILWHGGCGKVYTNAFKETDTAVIGVLYNGAFGTITYYRDGICLGKAFTGLNSIESPLYPMLSSTAHCTFMKVVTMRRELCALKELCLGAVNKCFKGKHKTDIDLLPLPESTKKLIKENLEETDSNTNAQKRYVSFL